MMENHEGPQLFGAGLQSVSLVEAAESTMHCVIEDSSAAGPKAARRLGVPTDSSGTALLIWNNNEVLSAVCEKKITNNPEVV